MKKTGTGSKTNRQRSKARAARQPRTGAPLRLNLGAGDTPLDGFENLDRKNGQEVFPLAVADGSVDEIRASHILEHFSHRAVADVLADWVRALKPGGLIKLAVPDFQWVAEHYLADEQIPALGYIMGGHVDANDHHGVIFDEDSLRDLMARSGLFGVTRWASEGGDCSALDVSLNLQGFKPPTTWPKVTAVMSTPRLAFMDNMFCALEALQSTRTKLRKHTGAYWGNCLTHAINVALKEDDPEFILTIDYDSVYTQTQVEALIFAAMRHPDVDAVAPIQAHRLESLPLMTVRDAEGNRLNKLPRSFFEPELSPIRTAHFGLTLIRVSSLLKLPKPWFLSSPGPDGEWGRGRTDADIAFWLAWELAGFTVSLANRVVVGHGEFMVRWPGRDMKAIYQHPNDFWTDGPPEDAWR